MASTRFGAMVLLGCALWGAHGAMGQESMRAVCDEGLANGCVTGTFEDNPFPTRPPQLFAPASDTTHAASIGPSTTPSAPGPRNRRHAVQIDFAQLSQARDALVEERGVELTVNLPDLPLPVVLTTASDTRRGYALSGRVANDPLSAVNIVVNGRSVAGNIRRGVEWHTIRTAGAGYYVQRRDDLAALRCEAGQSSAIDREAAQAPRLQNPSAANAVQNDSAEDDGSEIDVLVVYTRTGRRSAGGHQGIRTLLELLVQETNQAYHDSDVQQRIRLVGATELDYDTREFYIHDTLDHLTGKSDGYMDEVHQIRDLYAADLVLLFRSFGGGTAWHVADPTAAYAESRGFSVSNSHVFAHELGHNMGLLHDRTSDTGNLPYPYSHGFYFRHRGVNYGTIMATADPIPRFSNPRHRYPNDLGVPLGVPGETPTSSPNGPADAARSLNQTAAAVANFRSRATMCQYGLPSPKDVSAQGGSFTISIITNCSWDARSLDPGLSITEDTSGIGNGKIAFTVEQNWGWPREMGLRVAGEVYSFRQEGYRQPVSVCDRSASVLDALSTALDGQPCAEIAAEDLAGIGTLTVWGNVSPGDFEGLTGLGSLTLRLHGRDGRRLVPHLDQGTFADAGLEDLHELTVIAAATSTLHLRSGVFEGLDALRRLSLFSTSWDEGVFEDTPSLESLILLDYPRNILPGGAFRGLNQLAYLNSHRGLFQAVDARAFQGLSSLRLLAMLDGHLAHLPIGSFEGLPELTYLNLDRNRLTTLRTYQFRGASKISQIDLRQNPLRIVEAGAFSDLPLRYLNLKDSDLTSLDLDVFTDLFNCALDLSGNKLTTLDPRVFTGAGLVRLDLSNNDIVDVGFLAGLSYAQEIDLSGNKISDISPLISIGRLSTLDLSKNSIVDVSPLAAWSNQLTSLDLSHNEIGDISPLLVRDGAIGEGGLLFLHGNPLNTASGDHVAMLRFRGVEVFHVRVWPMDASALEGDTLEFSVHLSSEVSDPVFLDWQLVVAQDSYRPRQFANTLLTATLLDFALGYWGCYEGLCSRRGSLSGGELTIGAMFRRSHVNVSGVTMEQVAEQPLEESEEHETFAFVLLPHASNLPVGVALDHSSFLLRQWFAAERYSASVGLIVDPGGPSHHVPLFLGREDAWGAWGRQSVLRLVYPMDGSPAHVEVFDVLGRRHGATTLSTRSLLMHQLEPSRRAVAQFNSEDLENGNYDAGLSRGVGPGSSDWRLKVWANDVKVRSYVRHADGFLTSMHDVALQSDDGAYAVPFFNPADDTEQRSVLRLVNPGTEPSEVRIVGIDDAGASPGGGARLSIEPGGARELSAAELEAGTSGLGGALGDGHGRWRLTVAGDEPLLVASLLESPNGRLANLSTMPNNKERGAEGATTHHVPLFLSTNDEWNRHSFLRIVNKSENAAVVRIRAFDDTDRDYDSVSLSVAAGEAAEFDSHHLEAGGGGLSSGVGAGEGDWRLEVESPANIDVLAYVHHADGFLTAMHDMVGGTGGRHVVPIFNPADDDQSSLLRLVNPRGEDAEVSIRGFDDRGTASRSVRLVVPAGRSRTISAQQMEAGHDALEGALGNGEGKWRLVVRSEVHIQVMSLLQGPAGHLTNLSTTP